MFKLLVGSALALGLAVSASAATITSLYSTGVDNNGVATTGNGADLHWSLGEGPVYTGGTNGVYPIGPWVAETSSSRWVTPTPNAADSNAVAPFTYFTSFDLTGLNIGTAAFSGQFAADDQVVSITLNGRQFSTGGGGYTSFTGFNSAGAKFVKGFNVLTFTVLNNGGGPTGLNVQIAGTAAVVPEAATWALMIAGFGLVGVASRRRVRSIAA